MLADIILQIVQNHPISSFSLVFNAVLVHISEELTMNIGKIILLLFTLLIGVLQAQDEQQKGVNEDDFPTLTMVTHLKVHMYFYY